MMTAVLPLISPEKGTQLGFVAQGLMLVVSGVYYPVSVLPGWMQWIAKISPATYALRGNRAQILHGSGLGVGGCLAAARDRGSRDPARPLRFPGRRAVREAQRQAEALGLTASRLGSVFPNCLRERRRPLVAMIESKDRATSDPEARKDVLKQIEKQGVEYLLLWFTDLEGHLKSFAVTPSEIEGALNDGMGFDGSSITGFNAIEESDMVAIPDPRRSG